MGGVICAICGMVTGGVAAHFLFDQWFIGVIAGGLGGLFGWCFAIENTEE